MSDEDVKQAYWRRIRGLTLGMIGIIIGFTMILPLFMPALNAYRFLRFPLGYFLVANVSMFGLAILLYGFFGGQQKSDRAHNVTIQF
jgi:putative solute:sodium symporter small subunit